ncbi:unnamed protein product [Trichobilharzia regenti]|nr:unnamed protein product [Trichobilharzia regenti]
MHSSFVFQNHLISFHQNTSENSTNISAASSRVNTPIPHLSGKPVTMLKQHLGRPSSAPCFVSHLRLVIMSAFEALFGLLFV